MPYKDEAGHIWDDDGKGGYVLIQGAQQRSGSVVRPPPDPQTVRTNERQDRNDGRIADNQDRQYGLDQQKFLADLEKTGRTLDAHGKIVQIPGWQPPMSAADTPRLTAKERADALKGYTDADALERVAASLEQQFKTGPGATKGVAGLQDYLPTATNKTFDDTSFQARGRVKSALGFTGGEGNTIGEIGLNYGPFLPEASDKDGQIVNKIEALRQLAKDSRTRSVAILGGVPDANGRITPLPDAPKDGPNAMLQPFLTMGGQQAAGAGAKTERVPIPKAMQDEYNDFVAKNLGRLSPDDYATFRAGLDAKYGFGAPDATLMQGYREEAGRFNEGAQRGSTMNLRIPGPERKLSGLDKARNDFVSSPVGAAATGFANMGGFGVPERLAGDQYQALRESQPLALAGGEIAGTVLGTSLVGGAAGAGARRLAPKLLGGGGRGQFARNIATDMAYSGGYGGVTDGDPLTGAVAGGIGSLAGQGVGKLGSAAIGGLAASPAAQALRQSGIATTVGQTLGGIPKSLEDAATSLPGIGDMIQARRLDGLRDFNRVALAKAGEPVQAVTSNLGEQGANDLLDQISGAYDNATAGVRVPLDAQFGADMGKVAASQRMLPADYASKLDIVGQNRVAPIVDAGEMTGDAYQQSMRGLKASRSSAGQAAPGFEQEYKDSLSLAMAALTGNMKRGGGEKVVKGLGNADQAYRGLKTLQKAMAAAKNGSGSGEGQIFTPAQLNTADYAQAAKFGGQRQFGELADAGQAVLPSQIPDSGTAKRVMTGALATAGVGGAAGGGVGYAGDNTAEGAIKGAALGGLLALGGTKTGQKIINEVLTGRPEAVKKLGQYVRKHQGKFGAAGTALSLGSTN